MIAIRLIVALACVLVILWHKPAPITSTAAPTSAPEARTAAIGEIMGNPSLSAAQVNSILASYGSPAVGSGQAFYDLSIQYGIDDAYALAFFMHESSMGTDPNWAGIKPDGSTTHGIGNIVCAGWNGECYGRFRDYPSWRDGIEDWYRLITNEYIPEGRTTVATIIPKYAPSFENDVDNYVRVVNGLVAQWRSQK